MFKKTTEYKGVRNILEFQLLKSNLVFFQHTGTETDIVCTEANGNLLWKQKLQFDAHSFHADNDSIYVPNEPDIFVFDANAGNLKEEFRNIGYLGFPINKEELFVDSKLNEIYTASILKKNTILWQLDYKANFEFTKNISLTLPDDFF